MYEAFLEHLGTIITAILGAIAWLFERRKRTIAHKKSNLELEQLRQKGDTENQSSVVDLYQEALDDLKKRYDEKFQELEKDVEQLRKNVELWKGKYRTLKDEFTQYKAQNK